MLLVFCVAKIDEILQVYGHLGMKEWFVCNSRIVWEPNIDGRHAAIPSAFIPFLHHHLSASNCPADTFWYDVLFVSHCVCLSAH